MSNRFMCLLEPDNRRQNSNNNSNSNSNISSNNSNNRYNNNNNNNRYNNNNNRYNNNNNNNNKDNDEINNFRKKEIEQQKIQKNEGNFPSLIVNPIKSNEPTNMINYDSIVKNKEKVPIIKKQIKKLKNGWIELNKEQIKKETKEETNIVDEYLYFLDCMSNLYEIQKIEKIEILGEEIFEANYRFQNYDYRYFDKLDEKYESDLRREIKKYENDLYGYGSDNNSM